MQISSSSLKKKFNLEILKCYQENEFTSCIYLICMYKQYLALNNLQWLIYYKTQPNQIIYI